MDMIDSIDGLIIQRREEACYSVTHDQRSGKSGLASHRNTVTRHDLVIANLLEQSDDLLFMKSIGNLRHYPTISLMLANL